MNGFNFNITAGASQSTFKPQLPGNEIYEVTFDGASIEDIQGKKDPSQVYKVLKLRFSNEKGQFEHTIFEPRPEDFNRGENKTTRNGEVSTFPTPSNVESMMLLLKHVIDSVLPEVGKKIDNGEVTLGGKDWDQLRNNVVKVLEKGKGVSTKIKLLSDLKGNPRFPGFFTGLNQEGKAYIRTNFVGNTIGFNSYEKTRIDNAVNAKPTSMDNSLELPAEEAEGLDLDFEVGNL
jgi:hypothetical protein